MKMAKIHDKVHFVYTFGGKVLVSCVVLNARYCSYAFCFNEHHDKVWTFYNFDFAGQQVKMAKIHNCKPFQENRVYFKHYAADCLPSV